jgi:hypothetical protein
MCERNVSDKHPLHLPPAFHASVLIAGGVDKQGNYGGGTKTVQVSTGGEGGSAAALRNS